MPHCSSVPLFLPHRELATLCREQPTPLCLYCLLNQYVHASAQRSAAAAPNVEKTGSTRVMPVAGCSRDRTPPHRERTTASVESRLTDDTRFRGCEAWSRLTWMEQWKTPLHIEPHYRRWLQRQPETLQAHTVQAHTHLCQMQEKLTCLHFGWGGWCLLDVLLRVSGKICCKILVAFWTFVL